MSRKQIMIILSAVIVVLLIIIIVLVVNRKETNEESELNIPLKEFGSYIVITETEEEEIEEETEETEEQETEEQETEEQETVTTNYYDYSIILSDDKYYLVGNDIVLSEVSVSDDYTGKTYYNSNNSEYVYAVCYKESSIIDCSIGRKINPLKKYGCARISTDDYKEVTMYNSEDGTFKTYVDAYRYGGLLGLRYSSGYSNDDYGYSVVNSDSYTVLYNLEKGEVFKLDGYTIEPGTSLSTSVDDDYTYFYSDSIIIKNVKTDKYGLIDYQGNIIIDCEYDDVYTNDSVILVEKDNKYGAIDYSGKIVIPISYDSIRQVTTDDGLYYVVSVDDKLGIINSTGKVVVDINYEYANNAFGGFMLRACCGNGHPYYAQYSYNNIIEISFTYLSDTRSSNEYTRYIKYNTSTGKLTTGTY